MISSSLDLLLRIQDGDKYHEQRIREKIVSEAQGRIRTVIPAGDTGKTIPVASLSRSTVKLLILTASKYDDNTGKLKYKVGNDPTLFKFTNAHVFRGPGQAAFLPDNPEKLIIANAYTEDIVVDIYLLWDLSESSGGGPSVTGIRMFPDVFMATAGQTNFSLTQAPDDPSDTMLFLGPLKVDYGVSNDFYVAAGTLIWTDKKYVLEAGDILEARYIKTTI